MRRRSNDGIVLPIIVLGLWFLFACGVLAFWGLGIYALYLLVTGQLHFG